MVQIPCHGAEACPLPDAPEHPQATAPCAGPDRVRHTEKPPTVARSSNSVTDYWLCSSIAHHDVEETNHVVMC